MATNRTPAITKIRKDLVFESGFPRPPFPARLPAAAGPEPPAAPNRQTPKSDLGASLPAVNGHTCPADPARARRREERDHRPDLFGAAEPPKRQFPLHEFRHPRRIGLDAAVPGSPRKPNRPRRDAVDPDVVGGQLLGHRLREADFRGLDGVIGDPSTSFSPP